MILSVAVLFFSSIVFASEPVIEERLLEGQEFVFERKYDEAMNLFRSLQQDYPDSPSGFLGELFVYQIRMLENEDMSLEDEFRATYTKAKAVCDGVFRKRDVSSFDLLFSAGIIGLDAMHAARRHLWWHAYKRGTLARQILNHIRKDDPNFIDANIGKALYLYWRTVFTKMVPVLSVFLSDRCKEGMATLEDVIVNGRLTKKFALVNRGIIELEDKRYDDAISTFTSFIREYPQNVMFKNFRGRAFLLSKRYEKAIDDFKSILKIDNKVFRAHYFIGLSYWNMGKTKYAIAKEEFKTVLNIEKDNLWRSYCLYWLGRIADVEGDKRAAAQYYSESYELNKGLKDAQFRLHALGSGI